MIGSSFHMIYMIVLLIYTNLIYVNGRGRPNNNEDYSHEHEDGHETDNSYSILLMIGTIYPALYDFS